MGNAVCGLTPEEKEALVVNRAIETQIKAAKVAMRNEIKLVLLGKDFLSSSR